MTVFGIDEKPMEVDVPKKPIRHPQEFVKSRYPSWMACQDDRPDSADREPTPFRRKYPEHWWVPPVEDLADSQEESDDMEDNDTSTVSIGDIDVTWESEVEDRSPIRLPDDLAYAIATIGNGLRNA